MSTPHRRPTNPPQSPADDVPEIRSHYFKLDESGAPVPATHEEWSELYESPTGIEKRRVALTDLGPRGTVSTVFLGLDHGWGLSDEPVLWETMVFDGPLDDTQVRYTSGAAAIEGHALMVARLMTAATEKGAVRS